MHVETRCIEHVFEAEAALTRRSTPHLHSHLRACGAFYLLMCGAPVRIEVFISGIFVADILKAVPINKYFELYKAKATDQSEGGFIKVSIEYEDHTIRQRAGTMLGRLCLQEAFNLQGLDSLSSGSSLLLCQVC